MSRSQQHADPETLARIAQAQTFHGRALDETKLPFRHLGEMIDQQCEVGGNRPYLIAYRDDTGGRREEISYTRMRDRVDAVALFMQERLGLTKGDRLATLLVNEPETVVIYFAAFKIGVVVVPINVAEEPERIRYILEHSEARALIARADTADRGAEAAEGLALLATRAQLGPDCPTGFEPLDLEALPGGASLVPPADLTHRDEALIVYTSGTTAQPKGVVLVHGNLLIDACAISRWHGFRPEDRLMCVLPIHHVNGMIVTLVTPMLFGGSTVLCGRFRTSTFWMRIRDERVNAVSVVPTLLQFLCEDRREDLHPRSFHDFRYVICGAGPLTVDLGQRFEEAFGVPIIHGYGLSETTCYNCFLPIDLPPDRHRTFMRDHGFPSIGVPIDCNEMTIHDAEGRAAGPGVRGEIVVRGWDVMRYYLGRPEVNRDTFAHGWFRTGDEGFFELDEDNRPFFFITGRIKELIIRGGVNISPFEIDEVLNQIPGIARGLAVGFDNDWYGEEVGAYVKRDSGAALDEQAVLDACRDHLPFHKQPKCVVFGDEIPVTSTGKYQRIKLKPLFGRWKREQFRDRKKR